ncbi:hypothetical protein MKZ17_10990 [Solibacillus sp. FSL R7-0682]|uniref:hypothetical protein n=1 Tax=Solibacillus sp. FSL R7-0682 TaxID=2921690 RepID=UPI0030FBC65C
MKQLETIILVLSTLLFFVIPTNVAATSWVYSFVVWDGHIYQMTEEEITAIDKRIGKVTSYSDMESLAGNFSNHYPKGTKYFSIQGIDPNSAIAVEVTAGKYLKAINNGEYTAPNQVERYVYKGVGIFVIVIAAIIIITRKRRY